MKLLLLLIVPVFCFFRISFSEETKTDKKLSLLGSLNIQAQKDLYDNGKYDNLKQLYGRINFGVKANCGNFSGLINLRAYPGGFGYDVLTGATYDTTGRGSLKTSSDGIAKFQVEQAWVQYASKFAALKIGRFSTSTSKTCHFGNFINQNPGGSFMAKTTDHNAIEIKTFTGPLNSSIMLCAGDNHLNTGDLRIFEKITLFERLIFGSGYFSNIFDKIHDENAEIRNRFAVTTEYMILESFIPYFEAAAIQNTQNDSWNTPLLFGCVLPSVNFLNSLILEMEYSPEKARENNPLGLNLWVVKTIGSHTKFNAGLFTDTDTEEFGKLSFGLRFTAAL